MINYKPSILRTLGVLTVHFTDSTCPSYGLLSVCLTDSSCPFYGHEQQPFNTSQLTHTTNRKIACVCGGSKSSTTHLLKKSLITLKKSTAEKDVCVTEKILLNVLTCVSIFDLTHGFTQHEKPF